ncbi:unnamed protein product, partial [marine sediment metagenome]
YGYTLNFCSDGTLGLAGVTFTNWGAGYNGKSEKRVFCVLGAENPS